MKLAELLLQRVQLQNDLNDQAQRIQENAQVLEGELPLEDPELILKGLLLFHDLRLVNLRTLRPSSCPAFLCCLETAAVDFCCRVLDHYRGIRDDAEADPGHQRQVIV